MAASIRSGFRVASYSKLLVNPSVLKDIPKACVSCCKSWRHFSSNTDNKFGDFGVTLSHDRKTVICWHPQKKFPYEHSKPMPRHEVELGEGESVLKVKYLMDEKERYRADGPTDKELMKMFHTTRHTWDSKPQRRYAQDPPPNQRKAL